MEEENPDFAKTDRQLLEKIYKIVMQNKQSLNQLKYSKWLKCEEGFDGHSIDKIEPILEKNNMACKCKKKKGKKKSGY